MLTKVTKIKAITSYSELFQLWSNSKKFQETYPFLTLLARKYNKIFDEQPNESGIEYFLRTEDHSKLDEEEIKKYMFPYFDTILSKDNTINLDCPDTIYQTCSVKSLAYYILYKKLPVTIGNTMRRNQVLNTCLKYVDITQAKEFFEYYPTKDTNGLGYIVNNYNSIMKLYAGTGLETYKTDAFQLLVAGCLKESIPDVCIKNIQSVLNFIETYDISWPDHQDKLYNFIKTNKKCDMIDLVAYKAFLEHKNQWYEHICISPSINKYFIDCCKQYNLDINTIATNGSYLVHYAAQQYSNTNEYNWMKELLDYGAKLFDDDCRYLIKGCTDKTIFNFCPNPEDLLNFLLDYYKDNSDICDKLKNHYADMNEPNKIPKYICIGLQEEEEVTLDPTVQALLDSITDPTIKDSMLLYYKSLMQ